MLNKQDRAQQIEAEKARIRTRYRGVDRDELDFIPAMPKERLFEDATEKNVGAYARVSTDDPRQTSSYELQKNHYEDMIKEQPGWKLIGIYADEGLTGTSMKNRDAFNQMIADCEAGKIDLVITKSVARFARNVVDCISTVRKLAALRPPVGVYFEAERISTLDNASEMMLSLLSMTAQEESRNKSEIMNISIEQRFARGVFLTPPLLGYDRDDEGNLVINPEEAKTVKLMYYMLLGGYKTSEIAGMLNELKLRTKSGNRKWCSNSIVGLLRNERHCGDVLARKTFTPNYLDHKARKNQRERNQYRQRNHHDGIVTRAEWLAAQKILDSSKYKLKGGYAALKVIKSGALTGYVPINKAWAGADLNEYIAASRLAYDEQSDEVDGAVAGQADDDSMPGASPEHSVELAPSSNEYQVVRWQNFAVHNQPIITFTSTQLCVGKINHTRLVAEFVELLLNPVERMLVIRPCDETHPGAVAWGMPGKTRRTYGLSGFAPVLFELMEWSDDYRYRIRGTARRRDGEAVLLFDLDEAWAKFKGTRASTDDAESSNQQDTISTPEAESQDDERTTDSSHFVFGERFSAHQASSRIRRFDIDGQWDIGNAGIPIEEVPKPDARIEAQDIAQQLRERTIDPYHNEEA